MLLHQSNSILMISKIDDANSSLPILGEAFPEDEKNRIHRMKTPTYSVPIRTGNYINYSH